MARIFKQQYTTTTDDGRKLTKQSAKWYVEYRDGDDRRRRVPGYTDKQATQQFAAELERRTIQERSGLRDRFTEHRKRPLKEHLDDWRAALASKGVTPEHTNLVVSRARRVLLGTQCIMWLDLSASKVQAFVAELIKPSRKCTPDKDPQAASAQTKNFHLQAVKQFARWMVCDGRAPDNPLAHLQGWNARTDRRHDRRALDDDELRRLLHVAGHGLDGTDAGVRFGMVGADRAMLYRLAVETGLRFRELASLTWAELNLASDSPTVTVRAAYAKNRRADTLPLRPATAQRLIAWRDSKATADRTDPAALETHQNVPEALLQPTVQSDARNTAGHRPGHVFAKLPSKPAKMIRADLADARAAWIAEAKGNAREQAERRKSAFLTYRDDAGRVVDFHALRHTFISNLARGGVHPKVAQQLARHSTITLTMDRYSHTSRGELADALTALPDLSDSSEPQPMVATGTDPKSLPISLPLSLPKSLPRRPASGPARLASARTFGRNDTKLTHAGNAGKSGLSCTALHRLASKSDASPSLRPAGLEPATPGLGNRCSIH